MAGLNNAQVIAASAVADNYFDFSSLEDFVPDPLRAPGSFPEEYEPAIFAQGFDPAKGQVDRRTRGLLTVNPRILDQNPFFRMMEVIELGEVEENELTRESSEHLVTVIKRQAKGIVEARNYMTTLQTVRQRELNVLIYHLKIAADDQVIADRKLARDVESMAALNQDKQRLTDEKAELDERIVELTRQIEAVPDHPPENAEQTHRINQLQDSLALMINEKAHLEQAKNSAEREAETNKTQKLTMQTARDAAVRDKNSFQTELTAKITQNTLLENRVDQLKQTLLHHQLQPPRTPHPSGGEVNPNPTGGTPPMKQSEIQRTIHTTVGSV